MDGARVRSETPSILGDPGIPRRNPAARFAILDRAHPERPGLERFIADSYARLYGARITHYAEHLVGLRDSGGDWLAGLGYTFAGRDPLFVEQYLDCPIEDAVGARLGSTIDRHQIVEVGNLAASQSGAARRVIVHMTALLHELRGAWVVFTSTRSLLNSFARLKIDTMVLARAEPARLPDGGASWGTYYASDPHVMTANIPRGFKHLKSTAGLQRV